MTTLYDHRGNPIKSSQLTREIAAPSLAGVRTVWDSSVAMGMTPAILAGVLHQAANGDSHAYLTLAEEIEERDLHYSCEIGKRKLAVSSLPVVVEAASDESHDVKLADAVRDMVKRDGFRGLCKDLLDGIAKGYSVCEIIWQRTSSSWSPAQYKWRDPRFFTFDQESRCQIRLLDEQDMAYGIELEPYKFIVHYPHLKTGIPIKGGLARVAAWAWLCKSYTVKDWLAFAEVFGMPLRVGKYGPGASPDDIDVLKMAVANLGSDAAAVIPQSMLIEFVESAKSTGGDALFLKLADWLDAQVSKGVLGQTASASGTPGKLGNDETQNEVRHDIRDDDAVQLSATLGRDLVKPFIDLNFGPQENYPQIFLRAADEEDITALTTALKELVPLGLEVEQSVVRDRIGLPDPKDGAKLLFVRSQGAEDKGQDEATASNRAGSELVINNDITVDAVDDDGVSLLDEWEPQLELLETAIEQLFEECQSFEELKARLPELTDNGEVDELVLRLAAAMMMARGLGDSSDVP